MVKLSRGHRTTLPPAFPRRGVVPMPISDLAMLDGASRRFGPVARGIAPKLGGDSHRLLFRAEKLARPSHLHASGFRTALAVCVGSPHGTACRAARRHRHLIPTGERFSGKPARPTALAFSLFQRPPSWRSARRCWRPRSLSRSRWRRLSHCSHVIWKRHCDWQYL